MGWRRRGGWEHHGRVPLAPLPSQGSEPQPGGTCEELGHAPCSAPLPSVAVVTARGRGRGRGSSSSSSPDSEEELRSSRSSLSLKLSAASLGSPPPPPLPSLPPPSLGASEGVVLQPCEAFR